MRPRERIDREGSGVREGEIIRFTFILTKEKKRRRERREKEKRQGEGWREPRREACPLLPNGGPQGVMAWGGVGIPTCAMPNSPLTNSPLTN